MTVLLIANADDEHLGAISIVLRETGVEAAGWQTSAYPASECRSINLANEGRPSITIERPGSSNLRSPIDRASSIWLWQDHAPTLSTKLHADDHTFVEKECRSFSEPLLQVMNPQALWVNPAPSIILANHAGLRFLTARQVGMKLPRTLFSNNPDDILAFLDSESGELVCKSFENRMPQIGRPVSDGVVTKRLTGGDRPSREELQSQPRMYQAIPIQGGAALVVVMGKHAFAFSKHERRRDPNGTDGKSIDHSNVHLEPTTISRPLARLIHQYMDRMKLQYGSFNFLLPPDEEPLFVDFDHQSPFLWIERITGFPLLDAFCTLLREGRPDFRWSEDKAKFHFQDLVKSLPAASE